MDKEPWWEDVFAPFIELYQWIHSLFPTSWSSWKRPHLNFLTIHYLYIIGATILFSGLLYAPRNMAYIDAVLFAAGTATQSGLNPIDVNNLSTYQQVVFMLGCCLCTPIFLNTIVVFVRLYWFERRFEHIVKEVRAQRRSRRLSLSRSRSRSRMQSRRSEDDASLGKREVGDVRRRGINVLKHTGETIKTGEHGRTKDPNALEPRAHTPTATEDESSPSNGDSSGESPLDNTFADGSLAMLEKESTASLDPSQLPQPPLPALNAKSHREITFADELSESNQVARFARMPDQHDFSKHVDFCKRQANEKTDHEHTLYIPGPKEFENGEVPQQLNSQDAMRRKRSGESIVSNSQDINSTSAGPNDNFLKRISNGISIVGPDRPTHHGRASADQEKLSTRGGSRSRLSISDISRGFSKPLGRLTNALSTERTEKPMPYFDWTATTGRNSAFLGLTAEQREELGGIEYRSLKCLALILICYYVGFHTLGMAVLLPWISNSSTYRQVLESDGQSPQWWGVFTPASMFNDLGFTLTPDSMMSFEHAVLPLLFGSFLIVIGNTGFPIMLRFIIWVLCKIEGLRIREPPQGTRFYQELRFLLDHPRRCFTLLFPSKATWWLFWVLVILNGIDLLFFTVLDLHKTVVETMTPGEKVLNGWFQAVSTRTAGFASVNISNLHAAIQVSYLIMMYISVFPIAISVRRTNVYEETSLGIFGGEEDGDGEQSYVSQHLRRQLSFDLWFVFLGLFIICIVEGDQIADPNKPAFNVFTVLFEIISAYGTVGLSLGYPNIDASFCAEFRPISKLVVAAMMIRGRHRGLPYALDRAILLPSEKLQQQEEEDANRRARRGSVFAEGQPHFNSQSWQSGTLDHNGLPVQYTGRPMDQMGESAGGAGLRRLNSRQSMAVSGRSISGVGTGDRGRQRKKSAARLLAGGLGAGPTFSKEQ